MNLENFIATCYIEDTKSGQATDFYDWPFPKELPNGISILNKLNKYNKNIELRNKLNQIWVNSKERRFEISEFYVKKWGGIRKISKKTIDEYVNNIQKLQEDNQSFLENINNTNSTKEIGIASWSKILTISDPNKYAIFDARVSVSLNCFQLIGNQNEIFFPELNSQNPIVKKFWLFFNANKYDVDKLNSQGFSYHNYLKLLSNIVDIVHKKNDKAIINIQIIEMYLFSKTEDLIKIVFPSLIFLNSSILFLDIILSNQNQNDQLITKFKLEKDFFTLDKIDDFLKIICDYSNLQSKNKNIHDCFNVKSLINKGKKEKDKVKELAVILYKILEL